MASLQRGGGLNIKWKINQIFVYLALSLLTLHGDINQLANFVSVNQTQNATISTTKSNRINHRRTFSIVNKLVRQFCVYVLCHLDDDAIVIDI